VNGKRKNSLARKEGMVYNKASMTAWEEEYEQKLAEERRIIASLDKSNLRVIAQWSDHPAAPRIYDAGDYWLVCNDPKNGSGEHLFSKKAKPMYPLAAIIKWSYRPADGVTGEEIQKLCYEAAEKYKDAR
jgi:hypothetical protein